MSNQNLAYLQEMGIQTYDLAHPERLQGHTLQGIELPSSCDLLIVSPFCPEGETASLFENILKTVNLSLDQALHLAPHQLGQLTSHSLKWIWFAGCDAQQGVVDKTLQSPLLSEIEGNQAHKRALWQQIQAQK